MTAAPSPVPPGRSAALRVSGPGQLAALVPHLTGFVPSESLVAVALHGPRARVGLTLRGDLSDGPGLLDTALTAIQRDRATSCALLVFTEEPSGREHPRALLVSALTEGLERAGVPVVSSLLVRDGRWWSYDCAAECCPPAGTPVEADAPAVRGVAAAGALEGRAVLASRAELVASIGPDVPLGASLARRRQEQALRGLLDHAAEVRRWRAALDACDDPRPDRRPLDLPALAAGLHLVPVRDEVLSWTGPRSDALLAVALQVARGCVPPHDAPATAVLAWVAYARGEGALALVALQRSLRTDPSYSLAGLLLQALDSQLPPAVLRAASRVPQRRRRA